MFSCEFCEVFKNIYFVEYLRTAATELGIRCKYSYLALWSPFRGVERVYKIYLKMISECFDELYVLVKNNITK